MSDFKQEPAIARLSQSLGIVEWFWINDSQAVERTLKAMKTLGINRLRTAVSWADYNTHDGSEWYSWLIPRLAEEVELLPCFLYTPPSLGIEPKTSSPPKDPKAYADFLDVIITRFGECFEYVELWNEPNNRTEYDYTLDPHWYTFGEMVGGAAYWAKQRGKKTVLAGMSPIDPNWIKMIIDRNLMPYIDVVGLHAFPKQEGPHWLGWNESIRRIKALLAKHGFKPEIWITETGASTWHGSEFEQLDTLIEAAKTPVKRVYWYSLFDLHPSRPALVGFHTDERSYHYGMCTCDAESKLLYRVLQKGGVTEVIKTAKLQSACGVKSEKGMLITGGAGFIGTNLAHHLLEMGHRLIIFDNLSRPGSERNLDWLQKNYGDKLTVKIGDLRDRQSVADAVKLADTVFHLAAQVAVTTSLTNPFRDFDVNAHGTLNLLEEIRMQDDPPPLIFTSTNKVYGALDDVFLRPDQLRYQPLDSAILAAGINEDRSLDFHSPYGCSKGAADQYVLDYARSYGIKAVVFRMSCIYGPYQLADINQGWVAHIVSQVIQHQPITLYGDGRQVRDILYIDDLLDAFVVACDNIDKLSCRVFNIGGGPENSISLLELLNFIRQMQPGEINLKYSDWRQGDQKYYVSDTARFRKATGWAPQVSAWEGITRLYNWLLSVKGELVENA